MDRPESCATGAESAELGDLNYDISESAWRIRDMPERLRPREEIERLGIENVSDAVLVAVILRAGVPGVNVVDLANALIRRYGSLSAMAAASSAEIAQMRGVGPVKAQMLKAALEIGRRLHLEAVPKRFRIRDRKSVV